MKKKCILMFLILITVSAFSQKREMQAINKHYAKESTDKTGIKTTDSLMFFDGKYFYINTNDEPTFNWNMEDLDGLTVNSALSDLGYDSNWMTLYDTSDAGCSPDTCFWVGATSWFNSAGQANDWIEFGPVSVPSGGGTLSWQHQMIDPDFSDGYRVYISTSGMSSTDLLAGANVFTRLDDQPPTAPDTNWTTKNVSLNSWAGQQIYVGFQHDAYDMFFLYLDNILITGETSVGINAEPKYNFTLNQNEPNPASGNTLIKYEIPESGNVSFDIYDISGRQILSYPQGFKTQGQYHVMINTNQLQQGLYYYSLKINDDCITRKMIVVR